MNPNLAAAQAYLIARQQALYDLECKEKGNVRATDPDQVLQDLPGNEISSRILYKHEDRENVSEV